MTISHLFRSMTFVVTAVAAMAQPTVLMNQTPTRVLGQAKASSFTGAANYVEGRELYQPQSVWVDVSSPTSILYVADSRNNRVLAWRNSATANAGAPADMVIGQRDFQSTAPQGPDSSNTRLASGFNSPTTVITDAEGNLYVADAGNNRILRFPKPFQQEGELLQVDLVIGQRSINENSYNQGQNLSMSDSSVFFYQPGGALQRVGMAFDPQRNLWITDPQNHRVLRYPVGSLTSGRFAPPADLVLGAVDFTSSSGRNAPIYGQEVSLRKDYLWAPTGIAFDSRGRLFVRDWAPNISRVLVWDAGTPFFNGKAANRIVGIPSPSPGQTLPPVNEYVAGGFDVGTVTGIRPGIFIFGTNLYVPDVSSNRIMVFDAYENWPAETAKFSPPARSVIGQDSFNVGRPNRNGLPVGNNGFAYPTSVWVGGSEMFVADTANNRVLALPGRDFTFNPAARVVGQTGFSQSGANLVEGREFYFLDGFSDRSALSSTGALGGSCVAVDGDRLYVADPLNNRVLGFGDVRRIKNLDIANIVIGQENLTGSIPNAPGGDAGATTERGLNGPTCVAVDKDGNLWVADSGNSRLLRFPKPFDQPAGLQRPNLVLGQSSFTARSTDATSRTMRTPAGIAFLSEGSVLVSDYLHNRVLRFRKPAGGDFQNGQAADGVFGQANFTDSARGTTLNRFSGPKGIAIDGVDRLYVADVLNNRILIFSEANSAAPNSTARQDFSGLNGPQTVYVNRQTGDIWVGDTQAQRVFRLLPFEQLPVGSNIPPEQVIASPYPLALGLDRFGNLITADVINRVTFYYPGVSVLNAASAARPQIAPSTYSSIYGAANVFGDVTKLFTEEPNPIPMPTVVADTRVLVNDKAAPIHFVSPSQVNFLVPKETPSSGTVEVIVERVSTGQVLAAGIAQMDVVAPAVFAGAGGRGQAAVVNQDGSVNSPSNQAARGSIISIFATGMGNLPGAPGDGEVTNSEVKTPGGPPLVVIGTTAVPDANVEFSGLAPGSICLWQINVRIPMSVAPGGAVPIGLRYRDTNAQQGLTIAVKQ